MESPMTDVVAGPGGAAIKATSQDVELAVNEGKDEAALESREGGEAAVTQQAEAPRIKPVIHLEVMKKGEVIAVLVVLWCSALLCLGLNFVHFNFDRQTLMAAENTPCIGPPQQNATAASRSYEYLAAQTNSCFIDNSSWLGLYETTWKATNGQLRRMTLRLGMMRTDRQEDAMLSCNISQACVMPSQSTLAAYVFNTKTFNVSCNRLRCAPATVDLPHSTVYLPTWDSSCLTQDHGVQDPWYVTVVCNDTFSEWDHISFVLVDQKSEQALAGAILRTVMMVWNIGVLTAYLLIFARKHLLRMMVPEQQWVALLLGAAVISSDAISAIAFLIQPSKWSAIVSSCERIIGQGCTLAVLLLLAKGGRQKKLRGYGWRFYAWPATVMLLFLTAAIAQVILANGELFTNPMHTSIAVAATLLLLALTAVIIAITFFVELVKTARRLSRLPYLRTRYRQLSMRFFILQASVVLSYIVATSIAKVAIPNDQKSTYVLEDYTWSLLLTIYISLLAVVYLPPLRAAKPNELDRMIDLRLARWVYTFARATYRRPPEDFPVSVVWRTPYAKEDGDKSEPEEGRDWRISGKALVLLELGFELLAVIHNPLTDTTALLARQDDRLVLAFRGTKSFTNIRTDVAAFPSKILATVFSKEAEWEPFAAPDLQAKKKNLKKLVKLPSSSNPIIPLRVHAGFWRAYLSVRPEVMAAVLAQPDHELYVTGHSLGGALGQLAALDLAHHKKTPVLVSFGSPRVGNYGFYEYFSKMVPWAMRIVVDGDPIPSIPKFKILWKSVYKHVGAQCVIDQYGNSISNPLFVERMLKTSSSSPSAHKNQTYEKALDACVHNLDNPENGLDGEWLTHADEMMHVAAAATLQGPSGWLPEEVDSSDDEE